MLAAWDRELARRRSIERWLDAGMGCCALRHPLLAELVQESLTRWHDDRYRLLAWCIMPNHVHVMIEPHEALGKVVQSWKAYTGRWALARNSALGLRIPGSRFWMPEYWDRYIRDEQHFVSALAYIHNNPVKAKLCRDAAEWRWSSAHAPLGARSTSSASSAASCPYPCT